MAKKSASQNLSRIVATNNSDFITAAGALAGTTIDAGNGNDTVTGSAYNDLVGGSNGSDLLYGGRGADTLAGGNGVDRLFGEAGDDRLEGGHGADVLSGDAGNDVFVYTGPADSAIGGMDCITDFARGADRIDLSSLLGAVDLAWGGTTPTANGVWYAHVNGNTIVYADIDGNPATIDSAIKLTGVHDLTAVDFVGVAGNNALPSARAVAQSGNEDATIAVTLGGSDSDGVVVGIVLSNLPPNGTLYTDAALTAPAAAGITYAGANPTFFFEPAADFNGSVSFQYTVVDDGGAVCSMPATATLVVNPVNDAPSFAVAGNVVVAEDAGPQTISAFASAISPGPANEAGQSLVFSLTTDNDALFSLLPSIDPATGTLTYQLAPDANGAAQVTVRLSDDGGTAGGGSDTAVSSFHIVATAQNDGPVNILPAAVAGDEDTRFAVPGIAIVDIDVNEAAGAMKVTVAVGDGTLTLGDAAGLAFLAGDGTDDAAMTFTGTLGDVNAALATLQYRGAADFNGTDTLTIMSDDQGFTGAGGALTDTDTVRITVNPVNDAPTAIQDSAAVSEDHTLSGASVLANDSDVDGDALSAVLVGGPTHGTLTLNADGTYGYAPDVNFNGTDSFTYRAVDGAGGQSDPTTVTITVNPVEDAPVAGDDRWFISQNTTAVLPIAAFLANDSDVDGDALTVTGLSVNGTTFVTDANDGTVDGVIHLNTGFGALAVDVTHGTATYAVGAATGSLSFYYQVSDGSATDVGKVTVQAVTVGTAADAIDLNAAPYNADAGSFSYIDANLGSDTLIGGAGADYLAGGGTDDLIIAGSFGNDTVDGGSNGVYGNLIGNYRLDILAFNGNLDLTTLAQDRIVSIETLSMVDSVGGAGSDSLTLNARDVIDLGTGVYDPWGATYGAADTIRVDGEAGDTLTLAGGNWSPQSASFLPAGYALYVHDASGTGASEDAYVLVQTSVTVAIA